MRPSVALALLVLLSGCAIRLGKPRCVKAYGLSVPFVFVGVQNPSNACP